MRFLIKLDAYDPSPLRAYMKQLGVPYFFESQGIVARARDACPTSICRFIGSDKYLNYVVGAAV